MKNSLLNYTLNEFGYTLIRLIFRSAKIVKFKIKIYFIDFKDQNLDQKPQPQSELLANIFEAWAIGILYLTYNHGRLYFLKNKSIAGYIVVLVIFSKTKVRLNHTKEHVVNRIHSLGSLLRWVTESYEMC